MEYICDAPCDLTWFRLATEGEAAAAKARAEAEERAKKQAEALANCEGTCKQVVTTRKGCVAFAIDGRKPCGPLGFANAARLGEAQNSALKFCYKHGGKDCVIRAWICDAKG